MCNWHLLPHISLRALAKLLQCTSSYKIAVFQFSWRKLRQVQTWFWHVTKVQSIIIFRESPENKVIPLVEFQIWSLTKVMNSASTSTFVKTKWNYVYSASWLKSRYILLIMFKGKAIFVASFLLLEFIYIST